MFFSSPNAMFFAIQDDITVKTRDFSMKHAVDKVYTDEP